MATVSAATTETTVPRPLLLVLNQMPPKTIGMRNLKMKMTKE
jgi:hypothetical protein